MSTHLEKGKFSRREFIRQIIMGMVYIDTKRCIPWADAHDCIVCEEMCPVPQKAIRLREQKALNPLGEIITVRRPWVVRHLCIGCGICERGCPVDGEAAIRVYTDGKQGQHRWNKYYA